MDTFNLEEYLDDIATEVEHKRTEAESGGIEHGPEHEKQAVHEAVGKRLGKQPSFTAPPVQHTHDEKKSYENPQLKPHVDELVKIAFERNIDDAVAIAKKQDNPALLDAFHDILTDHFYDQLVQRGKIKGN